MICPTSFTRKERATVAVFLILVLCAANAPLNELALRSSAMVTLKSSPWDQLLDCERCLPNLINVVSNLSRDFSALPPTKTLLLLHYHKTGHELSRRLASHALGCGDSQRGGPCKFFRPEARAYTVEMIERLVKDRSKNVAILPANLELVALSDWKDVFPLQPSTKLIHFIRDPFELLSSAFVYHSQSNIPRLERAWLNEPRRDPCNSANNDKLNALILSIQGGMAISEGELQQLMQLCESLYRIPNNETRLWTRLRKADYKEGLLLTSLGYLTTRRPQLLTMWKALQLSETIPDQVYTTMLSQWTTSYDSFQQSATQVCQMANLSSTNGTVTDCVQKAVEYAYINMTLTNHSHVMSSRISESQRQKHIEFLSEHQLIGPILRRLQAYAWHIWKGQFDRSSTNLA